VAQTKKKRQTKHRGTQAGTIESRGRTSRPKSRAQARQQAMQRSSTRKVERANRPPDWRGATIRAAIAAGVFFALLVLLLKQPLASSVFVSLVMFGLYVPMGYYTDRFLYNRRQQREAQEAAARAAAKAEKKQKKPAG
jgi:Flp pilus assembly protein TadB